MDALNTKQYLRKNHLPKSDIIFGTLPYTNMPNKIAKWADVYAKTTKKLVFYSYPKFVKRPSARKATDKFRGFLNSKFSQISQSQIEWLNIPPARVVVAQNKTKALSLNLVCVLDLHRLSVSKARLWFASLTSANLVRVDK